MDQVSQALLIVGGGTESYWATYPTTNNDFFPYNSLLQINGTLYPQAYSSPIGSFVGYSVNESGVLQSGWSTPNSTGGQYPENVTNPSYDVATISQQWRSTRGTAVTQGFFGTSDGKTYVYTLVYANGSNATQTRNVGATPYGGSGSVVIYYYDDGSSIFRGTILYNSTGTTVAWAQYLSGNNQFTAVIKPVSYGAIKATVSSASFYICTISVSTGALSSLRKIVPSINTVTPNIQHIASDSSGTNAYYIGYAGNAGGARRVFVMKAALSNDAVSWAVIVDSANTSQPTTSGVAFLRSTNTTYIATYNTANTSITITGIDDSGACIGQLQIAITGMTNSDIASTCLTVTDNYVYALINTFYAATKRVWLFKLPLNLNISASNASFTITPQSAPTVVSLTTTVTTSSDLTLTSQTGVVLASQTLTSSNRTVNIAKIDY